MTAFPTDENHGHWWLTTFARWERLHAVPGDALTWDDLSEAIDHGEGVQRRAACGPELDLIYAGMISRFTLPRCSHCCRALGIPSGDGTPCNEKSEAEARARRATQEAE